MSVAERIPSGKLQAWQIRIQDFIIDKELRGRGIGSHMLSLLLQLAHGEMDSVLSQDRFLARLLPNTLNEPQGLQFISGELSSRDAIGDSVTHLIRFYERHGFEITPVPGPGGIRATIRFDVPTRRPRSEVSGIRLWHGRCRRRRK